MKSFKKLLLVVLVATLLVGITGCGSKKDKNIEGKLEDIMEKLYDGVKEKPMMLENIPVTKETASMYIGTAEVDFKEAIASESMVGSIAHSVVLVRMNDKSKVEDAKKAIEKNVDPRKWICVGVEKDEVVIKSRGDLIIVVIVEDKETRNQIVKNFDNL